MDRWKRSLARGIAATCCAVGLLFGVAGGVSHAAPSPIPNAPRYIPCSVQIGQEIQSNSTPTANGTTLDVTLIREVYSRDQTSICGYRAKAADSGTVTASLYNFASGDMSCSGIIYSTVSGSGVAYSGEDSNLSHGQWYAQATTTDSTGKHTTQTACGS